MKKRLHFTLVIFICLVIIGIFLYKQLTTTIYLKEYKIGELVSIDIDNDGKEEKIKLTSTTLSNENTTNNSILSKLHSKKEIDINIDDNNYKFFTKEGENVLALGIADLNLDNKLELLVCVCDNSISPSYRKWNVYKYDNKNLIFIEKIYDGYITYNKLLNKLKVKYSLHQTVKPMTETLSYTIDF